MHPRLPSSKKWTDLPKDFVNQVENVLATTFRKELGKDKVKVRGRIYPQELLISVGVEHVGQLQHAHFEVSVSYKKEKDNVVKLLNLAIDAAGALISQYWETDDHKEFPRIWQELEFEKRLIHIQFTTKNLNLESKADQLLGEDAGSGLAGGQWDEETSPEEIKAKLGLDDDPEEGSFSDDDDDDGSRDPSSLH